MKPRNAIKTLMIAALPVVIYSGCQRQQFTLDDLVGKLSGPSGQELVKMAFNPDSPDLRRQGVVGLSQKSWGLREPHLKGYALLLKHDEDQSVRCAAARALGKSASSQYVPDLVEALSDPSAAVRLDSAVALSSMPGEPAQAALIKRCRDDEDADVRAACAKALRRYRGPEVIKALVQCLDDGHFLVRYHARQSLAELTGQDKGANPKDWDELVSNGSASR